MKTFRIFSRALVVLAIFLFPEGMLLAADWAPSKLTGGAVTVLAASDTDPSKIYAGTANGLYISGDSGLSWRSKILAYDSAGHIDFVPILSLAVDSQGNVFVGTRKGLFVGSTAINRFRKQKIDAESLSHSLIVGLKTTKKPFALSDGALGGSPATFLATKDAIGRTVNAGKTWDVFPAAGIGEIHSFDIGPDDAFYVTTDKGAFRGAWGDSHWKAISPAGASVVSRLICSGGKVFAVIAQPAPGLMESSDRGDGWKRMPDDLVANPTAVASNKNIFYFSGSDGVHGWDSTSDQRVAVESRLDQGVLSLLMIPDGSGLLAGTAHKGVWRLAPL